MLGPVSARMQGHSFPVLAGRNINKIAAMFFDAAMFCKTRPSNSPAATFPKVTSKRECSKRGFYMRGSGKISLDYRIVGISSRNILRYGWGLACRLGRVRTVPTGDLPPAARSWGAAPHPAALRKARLRFAKSANFLCRAPSSFRYAFPSVSCAIVCSSAFRARCAKAAYLWRLSRIRSSKGGKMPKLAPMG